MPRGDGPGHDGGGAVDGVRVVHGRSLFSGVGERVHELRGRHVCWCGGRHGLHKLLDGHVRRVDGDCGMRELCRWDIPGNDGGDVVGQLRALRGGDLLGPRRERVRELRGGQVLVVGRIVRMRELCGGHLLGGGIKRVHGLRRGHLPAVYGRIGLLGMRGRHLFCSGRFGLHRLRVRHVPSSAGVDGLRELQRGHGVQFDGRGPLEHVRCMPRRGLLGSKCECVHALRAGHVRRCRRRHGLRELLNGHVRRVDRDFGVLELQRWHLLGIDRGVPVVKLREVRCRHLRIRRGSKRLWAMPRGDIRGRCGRGVMHELRGGPVPIDRSAGVVRELSRGELLRVDGALGSDGRVRSGLVRVDRGERLLELSCGDLPGRHRPIVVPELRGGAVSGARKSDELHELPLGQLLRDRRVGGCIWALRGWVVLGRERERLLELPGGILSGQHGPTELRELRRGPVPNVYRPACMHELPRGKLLRHLRADICDRGLRGRRLLGRRGLSLL